MTATLYCVCGHEERQHDIASGGIIPCGCGCPRFQLDTVDPRHERCFVVSGAGEPARVLFDSEPTDDDLAAVSAIIDAAQQIELTPEQIERQRAAKARIHARNERIRKGQR